MTPLIGAKLKEKHATAWLGGLANHLYPGEEVVAITKTDLMRPMCNALAVTNARIVAFYGPEVAAKGIRREISANEIGQIEVQKKFSGQSLIIKSRAGEDLNFGAPPDPDVDLIRGAAEQLTLAGAAPNVLESMAAQHERQGEEAAAWARVEVVGQHPSDKASKVLKDHASPGETPWFVVGAGIKGCFAAFDDRCMIIKVGGMTSLMAGSFGGGRITTFHYTEITGIEYNSGMVTGVLEVLTPSYQGSANKDYWRGTNKGRNADANDPWTLSNTLPLEKTTYQAALPRLNEMRSRIAESKRPTVVVTAPESSRPQPDAGSLSDELTKLAALREQGLLDDAEFQAAKRAALSRHAG